MPTTPIAAIQSAVAQAFGITRAELLSRDKHARFAHPRAFSMALSQQFTKASLQVIAREHDRENHTTVLSGIRRARELIIRYPHYADNVAAAIEALHPQP